jgi:hypothetical protein
VDSKTDYLQQGGASIISQAQSAAQKFLYAILQRNPICSFTGEDDHWLDANWTLPWRCYSAW